MLLWKRNSVNTGKILQQLDRCVYTSWYQIEMDDSSWVSWSNCLSQFVDIPRLNIDKVSKKKSYVVLLRSFKNKTTHDEMNPAIKHNWKLFFKWIKKKIKAHFCSFFFKSIEQRLNVMIVLLYYKHWLHLAPDLIAQAKEKLLKSWTLEWPPSQLSMLIQRSRFLIWNMRTKWMFRSWQLIAILKFIKFINIFRMQSKWNIR